MRTMMKRLGLALLLVMALTLLLAPAALADGGHAKDFSDFDETDWENFWAGGMTICPECEE